MKQADISKSIRSVNLDGWSEVYLAAFWIVSNKIPDEHYQTDSFDYPLSQMVLVASHQLVEIMLFSCIRRSMLRSNQLSDIVEEVLKRVSFSEAFNKWPKLLTGKHFAKKTQPFLAARKLALRRNATVHAESALTTLQMARSALYTGVSASRAVYDHFETSAFPYEVILKKYPIKEQLWFSEEMYPPNKESNA